MINFPKPAADIELRPTCFRRSVVVTGLLLLFVGIFLYKNILPFRPAIPFDLLDTLEPWRMQDVLLTARNPELSDQIFQFYPWSTLSVNELRRGRIPLWNPFNFCGSPLLANGQVGVFYPLKIIALLFTPAVASVVLPSIRLFLAAILTFAFLRQLGLRWDVSLFGGIVFAFSRNFIVWLNFPVGDAAVLLPGLFWVCERLVKSGKVGDLVIGVVLVAAQFLAGQPQTSFVSALACSVYILFRLLSAKGDGNRRLKILLLYSTMWLLGACLAAVPILPMVEYMGESAATAFRYQFNLKVYPWYEVISFIVPDFFGTPYNANYWGFANLVGTACYIGIAPLVLALMSLTSIASHAGVRCFWTITAISIGIVYKLPLLRRISNLPFFNATDTDKFLVVIVFSLTVCSAIALEEIMRGDRKRVGLQAMTIGLILVGIIAAVHGHFSKFLDALHLNGYEKGNSVVFAALTAATCSILGVTSAFASRRTVGWSLLMLLSYIDLFVFGHSYNAASLSRGMPPAPAAVVNLPDNSRNSRVLGIRGELPPNTSILYGIADVRGYDALTPARYFNFVSKLVPEYADFLGVLDLNEKNEITRSTLFTQEIRRMLSSGSGQELQKTLRRAFYWNTDLDALASSHALDALNVGFVVAPPELRTPPRTDLEFIATEGASVFKNPAALPRTYLRHEFRITDDVSALDIATQSAFDFRSQLVLSGVADHNSIEVVFKNADTVATEGQSTIVREDPSHVEVSANVNGPEFLVLTDLYFPGWQAYLDGKLTPIYAANYLFRAVLLPGAGRHMVRFEYRPRSFTLGTMISAVALLSIISLGYLTLRSKTGAPLAKLWLRSNSFSLSTVKGGVGGASAKNNIEPSKET